MVAAPVSEDTALRSSLGLSPARLAAIVATVGVLVPSVCVVWLADVLWTTPLWGAGAASAFVTCPCTGTHS